MKRTTDRTAGSVVTKMFPITRGVQTVADEPVLATVMTASVGLQANLPKQRKHPCTVEHFTQVPHFVPRFSQLVIMVMLFAVAALFSYLLYQELHVNLRFGLNVEEFCLWCAVRESVISAFKSVFLHVPKAH